MKDLIPILLQYVESRRRHGGPVLLIAHNARRFDVPFLISEFSRCSFDIPRDWLFMDTVPLAREAMKSGGLSLSLAYMAALVKFLTWFWYFEQDQSVLQYRLKPFGSTIKFH